MTIGNSSSKQAYGEPWYWDNRYSQDPGPFDWYQKYPALSPLLDLYLLRHHRILLVGCGNSGTLDSLMCGHNAQQNATKMLEEVGRILKDKGIYILITYGAPNFRLSLLREPRLWTIKLHLIEKLGSEARSLPTWELTNPIPLDDDGSSVTSTMGENPDVHYIYVCIKDGSLRMQ
ncbi:hypothetical protein MRB53_027839 [Persea americana]|uniref:Uncharacterized protein n=1 Tax=Persea americana TaxID=3435 RepID=A0ACC2KDU5_PERAE|nr:hypothetical protein MRB53_027839 [Persea americana]